jgi:hypothetical protein
MKFILKPLILLPLFTSLLSPAQASDDSQPSTLAIPGQSYPRIDSQRRATFKLKAPDARQVRLHLDKDYDMERDTNGVWSVTTRPQVPGFHYYWFMLDGANVCDPASETFYGVSREYSGIEVPSPGEDFYDVKDVPHGEIRERGVAAPRDRILLFVRAGTILPTAPEMMFTGEKPWDPITLDVWPEGESTGSLYLDDDATTAFTKGEFTTTFHCVEQAGKNVSFTISPSNQKFGPQQWIAKFHLTSIPTAVTLDGRTISATTDEAASAGWAFETATYTLAIHLPGGPMAHLLAVALDGSSHPRPVAPQIVAPSLNSTVELIAAKQIAQFLPPPKLPMRIEAANFDKGGEGLAFHIATPSTNAVYCQEGVPIIDSTDGGGGYAIPDLQPGDWLAYSLDANAGGWFAVSARLWTVGGGKLNLVRKPFNTLTSIDVPASGTGGPVWTSVPGQSLLYLPPGEFILTASVAKAGFQLGNFTFSETKDPVTTVEVETGAITGAAVNNDHPGYMGTGFVAGIGSKTSSVVIPVNVPADGNYLVVLRYANGNGGAEVALNLPGGQNVTIPLPSTDAWDNYSEAGVYAGLKAGQNEIRVSGTQASSTLTS